MKIRNCKLKIPVVKWHSPFHHFGNVTKIFVMFREREKGVSVGLVH